MPGCIIALLSCMLCAIPFWVIAKYNVNGKDPISFWSSDASLKGKVTDVPAYNREMAALYKKYAAGFVVTGLGFLVHPIVGVVLLVFACTVGIGLVYRSYKKVLQRYSLCDETRGARKMKVGLFTDSHFCRADCINGNRRPALSLGKIREAMEAFREAQVDVCFCLGDLTDHDTGDTRESILDCLKEEMALIHSYNIPFYLVPGNHDYLMLSAEELMAEVGGEIPPYTVEMGGYTFIVLDANYRSSLVRFDIAGVDWTDANLPPEQVTYLEQALEQAKGDCIVLVHENLDPTVERHHIIKNAEEVRGIIARSGKVKAVWQGHYHWGSEQVLDGIPYLTLAAMCEGEDNVYRIIEL